jgi:hypothetical protein
MICSVACRGGTTRPIDPPIAQPQCGDGVIDSNEECDGSNLADQTCRTLGFEEGQLTCGANCLFVKTLCSRRCGNGQLDANEACDGALGIPACPTYGANRCSDTCVIDTSNCLTQAFESAPELTTSNGGPAVVADLPPAGVPDLVMAVPSRNRVEVFAWNTVQGFAGASSRKLSFQRTVVACVAGDLNGDGALDVGTVNDTGTFDAYLATGGTFSFQALDGGCVGAYLVGIAKTPGRDVAIATGCGAVFPFSTFGVARFDIPDASVIAIADVNRDEIDDVLVVDPLSLTVSVFGGPSFVADAGPVLGVRPSAFAMGDLDGDLDADLAAVIGTDVKVFENTGAGLAERITFAAPHASTVAIQDFDLDGWLDLFFTAQDDAVVRRNRRNFAFSEFRQNLGAGTRLNVVTGDVDGDGDLDIAATFSTGSDATRTSVVRNRAR